MIQLKNGFVLALLLLTSVVFGQNYMDVGLQVYPIAIEPAITVKYEPNGLGVGCYYGLTLQPEDISHTTQVLFSIKSQNINLEAGLGVNYGIEPYFTNLGNQRLIFNKVIQLSWSAGVRYRSQGPFSYSFKTTSPGFLQLGLHYNLIK